MHAGSNAGSSAGHGAPFGGASSAVAGASHTAGTRLAHGRSGWPRCCWRSRCPAARAGLVARQPARPPRRPCWRQPCSRRIPLPLQAGQQQHALPFGGFGTGWPARAPRLGSALARSVRRRPRTAAGGAWATAGRAAAAVAVVPCSPSPLPHRAAAHQPAACRTF